MMQPSDPSSPLLRSDLEDDHYSRAVHQNAAQQALDVVGVFVGKANGALRDLESNDMVGLAIVRKCQELADAVGGLAGELESRTDPERNALAQACLDGVQHDEQQHLLMIRDHNDQYQVLTQDDMKLALIGAQELLRDVESSLRSISQDEADELAEVALTLANMFVMSLQHFLDSTSAEDLVSVTYGTPRDMSFSDQIELLDDDSKTVERTKATKQQQQQPRIRCLWPPLGPAVGATLQWSQQEATKRPLLAVALGMILWPAAVVTAVLGTPVVACDALVQHLYQSYEHTRIIGTMEGVAAQALYAGKLTFLSTKLVVKQTLRVASRQVDRRGGLGAVVGEVKDMAVDRALHPLETAQQCWSGIMCTLGAAQNFVRHVQARIAQEQEKAQAQELH
jgi:hypothetical protein